MLAGCSDDGVTSDGGEAGTGTTTAASNTVTSDAVDGTGSFETTSVDTDDTAVDSSGGGGFIYGAPDLGGALECDLVANDCPDGEKCSPWANDGGDEWNATHCVPIARDPVGPGEACATEGSPVSGIDDCEPGSVCLVDDPVGMTGLCEPMCDGMLDSCPEAGDVCIFTSPAFVPLCYLECDPVAPQCPRGEVCDEISDFGICVGTPL